LKLRPLSVVIAMCLAAWLTGCSQKPLLYDVHVEPDVISPNADGVADVARITYALGRHASVTLSCLDEAGGEHVLRSDVDRPRGTYEVLFSGVVENRLLPDGRYTCAVQAVADDGERARVDVPLTVQGGEPTQIEIRNLNIYPTSFTPNRDGINDRVTIAYYLTKEASSVQVYLWVTMAASTPFPKTRSVPWGRRAITNMIMRAAWTLALLLHPTERIP
jgi:hypothetical protein